MVKVIAIYSREIDLEPSSNGYLIVCLSDDLESADEFELEVFSNYQLEFKPSSSMFEKFNHQIAKTSRWMQESSGGISTEKTFTRNNFYIVEVKHPDTIMMIEISSQTNLKLLVYLIRTDKRALIEVDQNEIDSAISPSECSAKYNSMFYDFGKTTGSFMIVPCNYTNEEGVFELKVSATKPVELHDGPVRGYQIRKDFELTMVNDQRYQTASSQIPMQM